MHLFNLYILRMATPQSKDPALPQPQTILVLCCVLLLSRVDAQCAVSLSSSHLKAHSALLLTTDISLIDHQFSELVHLHAHCLFLGPVPNIQSPLFCSYEYHYLNPSYKEICSLLKSLSVENLMVPRHLVSWTSSLPSSLSQAYISAQT